MNNFFLQFCHSFMSILLFLIFIIAINFFILHMAIKKLPERLFNARYGEYQHGALFAFFFAISSVAPVLGLGLSIACIEYIKKQATRHHAMRANHANYPAFRQAKIESGRSYGEGGAFQLATDKDAPLAVRLRSIINLNFLPSRAAQAVNKLLLQESVDDVRLYAYVITEKKRESIDKRVNHLVKMQLEIHNEKQLAQINKWLAESYWEYIYYKLLDAVTEEKIIQKIFQLIALAQALLPNNSGLFILLAQIYRHQKNNQQAIIYFEKALACGAPISQTIPYLLELFFHEKEYQKLGFYLKQVSNSDDNAYLKLQHTFWNQ